jgi:nucleoside-diphosphate-sugar epimerase
MPKDPIIKKSASIPTFLISNGISYLGLNLCAELLEKGARVIVLDVVTDEVRELAGKLLLNPNFALFNVDLNAGVPDKIESVDYIFQLMFPNSLNDPVNTDLVAQAFGTKSLLDLAVASKAKFALVEPLFSLKSEKDDAEIYSYDKNSEFLRSLVWDFVQKKKLDGRIIRLGPVYGPEMPLESPEGLSGFISSILSGDSLRIYGDGVAKIPYLYITDAIDGLIKALFYKKTSGRVFKLLGDDLHADLELVFVLKSMSNSDLKMTYVDEPREFQLDLDTSIGEQVPRWEAEVSLKAGLKKTLESFGYNTNLHSFKPAKMIEDRLERTVLPKKVLKGSTEGGIVSLVKDSPWAVKKKKVLRKPCLIMPIFSTLKRKMLSIKLPTLKRPKKQGLSSISSIRAETKGFNWRYAFFGVLVASLFAFIAPLSLTVYSSMRALSSLEAVSLNLSQLQTESSQESARQAFTHFLKAKNSFKQMHWIFRLTGKEQVYTSLDNTFESSVYFSGALYRTSKALDPFNSVWEILKSTSSQTFSKDDFAYSIQELTYARKSMDLALANFDQVKPELLPSFLASRMYQYGKILDRSDTLLREVLVIADSLPNVLGLNKEQKYLLLFQNSNEIRPTGGFIGSYALLTLDKGKIKNLVIDDIYNPDGQIDARKIVSEVPAPIKEFLNENVLHIRNANWSPDFPQTVATIEDLFFKLENRSFDGVVALDLNMVQSLLEITGPVFLAAYNEEINAQNLFERAQYHAEFDYQEGISEKRSFLTILGGKLMEKVFALPSDKLPEFGSAINSSLNSRSLQIYLKDPVMASFLADKKWNGGVVTTEGDFLMVVNANLGGTKANYFVENSYEYSVTSDTRDGLLRASLNLNYTHTGEGYSWPGGPYTDYLRIYTPLGVKLTGAKLIRDGQIPQDIFDQINVSADLGRNVFATNFVMQPQELLRLEISYDLPESLSLNKETKDYAFYWQKQAGTKDDLFRFSFKGPFGTEITSYKPTELGKEKNLAVLEGKLNQDQVIELSLK